jgi:hypothetical protein
VRHVEQELVIQAVGLEPLQLVLDFFVIGTAVSGGNHFRVLAVAGFLQDDGVHLLVGVQSTKTSFTSSEKFLASSAAIGNYGLGEAGKRLLQA